MKAIDVLRNAKGTTRVYNGETWFTIGEASEADDAPPSDAAPMESSRLILRKAAS